ncbi:MAG: hypothetical protein ACLFUS_11030 [Candidatus Sumerlaeia bacterium]
MRYLNYSVFSMLLLAAAAAGWWGHTYIHVVVLVMAALLLAFWFFLARGQEGYFLTSVLFIAGFICFVPLAAWEAGQFRPWGFIGLLGAMALLLVAYCVRLGRIFYLAKSRQELLKGFLSIDLWFLNIGLLAFGIIACLQLFQNGLSTASIFAAIWKGAIPLSFVFCLAMLVHAASLADQSNWIFYLLLAAMLVHAGLGATRIVLIYRHVQYAQRCHLFELDEEAALSLRQATAHNRYLRCSFCDTWIDEASQELTDHTRQSN